MERQESDCCKSEALVFRPVFKKDGQIRSDSLGKKAWRRLMRNTSAVIGMIIIILAFFLAIFGYVVAPDNTTHADDQILPLSNHPPGFKTKVLLVMKDNPPTEQSWWEVMVGGRRRNYNEPIPIVDFRFEGENIVVEKYRGEGAATEQESIPLVKVAYHLSAEASDIQISGEKVAVTDVMGEKHENTISGLQELVEKKHIETRRYWLGTDFYGRDILSRLILGVRVSLSVGFIAVFISLIIGVLIGAISGFYRSKPPVVPLLALPFVFALTAGFAYLAVYFITLKLPLGFFLGLIIKVAGMLALLFGLMKLGGMISTFVHDKLPKARAIKIPVDDAVMWLINVFWSIPTLLLAISLTIIFKDSQLTLIYIAVGLTMWVETARIVRGQFMSVRELEFVEAANSFGYSDLRIIFKHILPNITGPIIVITAVNFATAILIEAGLSYLGLGAQAPQPSWGNMLEANRAYIDTKPYLVVSPAIAIMILVYAFNLIGNGLRDALDVKTQLDN